MSSATEERVAAALGVGVVGARRVERGYTPAERLVLELADGRTVFAKAGTEELSSRWLREEQCVYATLEAPFLARLLAWLDEDPPVLVLEDLSHAHWPPPWRAGDVDAVKAALAAVAATAPPSCTPTVFERWVPAFRDNWRAVADDPAPFLSTGLADARWLERGLPTLVAAADDLEWEGDALLHFDVRSDNVCIRDGQALLVDWNGACVGNPVLDLAFWAPSLHAEGGPAPEQLVPDAPAAAAAAVAGYFASRAGLPPPATAPRVREVQLRQLATALPWAARLLGLPPPRAE